MESHLSNLLRRSRQPHQRAAAHQLNNSLEKKGMDENLVHALDKRLTPEQLKEIQDTNSRAAAGGASTVATTTANPATPVTAGAATEAVGGVASRIQTTRVVTSSSSVVPTSSTTPSSSTAPTTSSAVRTSSSTSVAPVSSSTSTTRSTSSITPSSSSTRAAALTVTSTRALSSSSSSLSSSSSATLPSVSAAAASQSSESTGLGTGPIVGIALAVLVGLVVVGSCIGWVYRKHAQRKYSDKAPWAKLDDNVTPFPPGESEKPYLSPDDDIYGHSQAPVIGSRRALALARQNGFNADGSMRPDSDYMVQRDGNNAGFGAGRGLGAQYGAYPVINNGYDYGHNAHNQGPPSPAYDYGSDQTGMAISAPGNTRQLVGSNGAPQGYPVPAPLAPVAMGRPAPPQSAAEFADREEFMDLPRATPTNTNSSGNHLSQYSTYGLAYAESEPDYMPHTATTTGWAGDAKAPQHTPLPTIEPASPLMSSFDFQKRQSLGPIASNFASKYGASTLPSYNDEDEAARQKRMYGEVASAAGVQEPKTPHPADLSSSTNSYETASSFSASEPRSISHRLPPAPLPALPTVNVLPPQPYQHGRPLSPLTEVETPRSVAMTSSSLMHGQEQNPFELAMPIAAPRPPYSAVSSTGASGFPSPRFPPPSPGGMSVPGSVTDSPRKRESMFDVDDAYGGI